MAFTAGDKSRTECTLSCKKLRYQFENSIKLIFNKLPSLKVIMQENSESFLISKKAIHLNSYLVSNKLLLKTICLIGKTVQ